MTVVGVNWNGEEDATRFRDELGLTYPIVIDESQTLSRRFIDRVIPWNAVVDREGVVRYTKQGFDKAAIERAIEEATAAAPAK